MMTQEYLAVSTKIQVLIEKACYLLLYQVTSTMETVYILLLKEFSKSKAQLPCKNRSLPTQCLKLTVSATSPSIQGSHLTVSTAVSSRTPSRALVLASEERSSSQTGSSATWRKSHPPVPTLKTHQNCAQRDLLSASLISTTKRYWSPRRNQQEGPWQTEVAILWYRTLPYKGT